MKVAALLASTLALAHAAINAQQINTLSPGQVFNLRAIAPGNNAINMKMIRVYGDSTLGTADPYDDDARLFHGVYVSDYGMVLQPEPLQCIKPNFQSVLMVNDSLYSPSTHVQVGSGRLSFSTPVHVCPSLNHVLIQEATDAVRCQDAVPIQLELVEAKVDHEEL